MTLPWQRTKARKIGLSREELPFGHQLEKLPASIEQSEAFINGPPKSDSSELSSLDADLLLSEPDTPPSRKRRKLGTGIDQHVDQNKSLPREQAQGYRAPASLQLSNIPATQFTSSDPSNRAIPSSSQTSRKGYRSENEEVFPHYRPPTKAKAGYGRQTARNIHKSDSVKREKHKTAEDEQRQEKQIVKRGSDGFKHCNVEPILSLRTYQADVQFRRSFAEPSQVKEKKQPVTEYKVPPVLSSSPRSKRATRRSATHMEAQNEPAHDRAFVRPPRPAEIKPQDEAPPALPTFRRPSPQSKDRDRKNPDKISLPLDAADLETIKAKLKMQPDVPNSSATLSMDPSFEFDHDGGSSSSSLSSVMDVEELQIDEIDKEWTKRHPPGSPKTQCPLCKAFVSRLFREEFSELKVLSVRQQQNFCKAHKVCSAERLWRERRYPTVDWHMFSKRLPSYDSALRDVLIGTRSSFYRNVLDDQIRSGTNRTLKQSIFDGSGGLNMGYYGTRGARIIMEYIMSKFASQIRRLASTDKLVSAAGVSGFVQAVLAPELAVMLVKDDMHVDDEQARVVLEESADIGHLLNEEEDETIKDKEEMKD
ncbi:MAG: hypothetical protein Q9219_004167 [cf. Caloplaca sp. 3 TL-2023]